MSTTTPLMSLVVSTVGVDSGLNWEMNLNSDLSILDYHNHTPGFGAQIPPAGLNINANLPFNGNSATLLGSSIYSPVASDSTIYSVYVIGADLYYTDGAGNVVRITSGGSVNATASGISDGSGNSAAFVAGALVVQNTSTAPDNIQVGSVLLGNSGTPASKFLTLSPPAAMAGNITETLPAIPGATSFMQMDSSGNMAASVAVAGGLTTSNLSATAGITNGQLAAVGQQISGSSGLYTTSSSTLATVTNMSVTITTVGKPVVLQIIGDGVGDANGVSSISVSTNGTSVIGTIAFIRASSVIQANKIETSGASSSSLGVWYPPSAFSHIDVPAAGTYTYVVQAALFSFTGTVAVTGCKLVAYEIP